MREEHRRRDILWVTGHGGKEEKPNTPPSLPPEVVEARENLRRAEAEFYCRRQEFADVIARLGRRR